MRWPWQRNKREDELLSALVWMACQYLEDNDETLDHMFMCAGEQAFEVLASYGLIEEDGRLGYWTEKGRDFMRTH